MSIPQPPDDGLEERLDAAFSGTRPRPGFERELWSRIEASGRPVPVRRRWAEFWSVGPGGFNLAPAVAALVLVALVGTGVLLARAPHPGGGAQSATSSAAAPVPHQSAGAPGDAGAARSAPAAPSTAAKAGQPFGKLPAPELGNPRSAELTTDSGAIPYFDAAELTWTGQLPALPAALPVYRYAEPQKPEQDAFAAGLKTSPNPVGAGYSSPDLNLAIFPSTLANGRETLFAVTPKNGATSLNAPADDAARRAADDFLKAHSLTPSWASVTSVRRYSGESVVRYARQFPIAGTAPAFQVDSSGKEVGIDVLVKGDGTVFQASGAFPLTLDPGQYPARSRDAALQDALARSVPGQVKVALTRATLVYEALADGDHGYYVPALLFTGVFQQGGQKYEKRLLVQILDPSSLR